MQKITPFLWFKNEAEEAVKFYTSIFKNSKTLRISRYGDAGPGPKGSVMTIDFELNGQHFIALNGNPEFEFNESISFLVNCKDQEEVDYYWEKLSAGGEEVACGWLKDKFGVRWQVTPTVLLDWVTDKDPAKAERVMRTMMQMVKLDIKPLRDAYEGK